MFHGSIAEGPALRIEKLCSSLPNSKSKLQKMLFFPSTISHLISTHPYITSAFSTLSNTIFLTSYSQPPCCVLPADYGVKSFVPLHIATRKWADTTELYNQDWDYCEQPTLQSALSVCTCVKCSAAHDFDKMVVQRIYLDTTWFMRIEQKMTHLMDFHVLCICDR